MTPKKKIGGGMGGRVVSTENSLDNRASAKCLLVTALVHSTNIYREHSDGWAKSGTTALRSVIGDLSLLV